MAKIADSKFAGDPKVQVICADVETVKLPKKFDRIVVYNAFPHFPHPKRLIKLLSELLKEDGRLTIAHGPSREAMDGHHSGSASKVSNGLMSAENLKRIFDAHFDVEVVISNRHMYQVSGVKIQPRFSAQSLKRWAHHYILRLLLTDPSLKMATTTLLHHLVRYMENLKENVSCEMLLQYSRQSGFSGQSSISPTKRCAMAWQMS